MTRQHVCRLVSWEILLLYADAASDNFRYAQIPIEAIVETYNFIPIGGVKFGAGLYTTIIQFMSDYFVIDSE